METEPNDKPTPTPPTNEPPPPPAPESDDTRERLERHESMLTSLTEAFKGLQETMAVIASKIGPSDKSPVKRPWTHPHIQDKYND